MKRPLKSIYIHIPFCKSKCAYCSFVSYANKETSIEDYFKALDKEIGTKTKDFAGTCFETIYIGGGTPSLVGHTHYEKLLSSINKSKNAEITIEVNPGTVFEQYLKKLRHAGFNRLSIGAQCFDNNVLKQLGRLHTTQDTLITVETARNVGFNNISIDLMYGLPNQTLKNWEETLQTAVNLDINHISTYCLKIEEGTPFFRNPPPNIPDEDLASEMFLKASQFLSKNGFKHYEISNFAKIAERGFESRHNLAYWGNQEYFGFGAGAHGYVNGVRYSNLANLEEYIANPLQPETQNTLSEQEILEEGIFLGLRLAKGIDIEEFKQVYDIDLSEKYGYIIQKYVLQGLMTFEENNLRLTTEGMLFSNTIMAEFLD